MAEDRLVLDLTGSQYNYQHFIDQLRDRASDPDRHSHELPVLPYPPQDPDRAETILIELRAGGPCPLMVRIRRHDLYLVGYQMQDGQWLEFARDDDTHLIDGSQYLNFGENYMNLGGLESDSFQVGYNVLSNAITGLVTETYDDKRKSLLRLICVMICEATRFSRLSNTFADYVQHNEDRNFEAWMGNLIHSWGDLSDRLLRSDAFPVAFRLPRRADGSVNILSTEPLNICDADSAVSCLGLLLGSYDYHSQYRSKRAAFSSDAGYNVGQPMVEVFSVRMNNIDGEDPGNLYGDIEVNDGIGSFYLYNRDSGHYEDVHPDGIASLVGPYRSISLCNSFTIHLDLKDKDSLSPDDEICKGYMFSDIFSLSTTQEQYDKPSSSIVNGAYGKGTVYYAMLGNAMEATIQVILINGDGENPADVYGTLVARYSDDFYRKVIQDEKKYYQTTLFNKSSDNYVEINPGNSIGLSRSIVAAPANDYSLIIEANLYDHDAISPDDEIAKGFAEFYPSPNQSAKQEITGRNGKIEVRVTWNPTSGGSS